MQLLYLVSGISGPCDSGYGPLLHAGEAKTPDDGGSSGTLSSAISLPGVSCSGFSTLAVALGGFVISLTSMTVAVETASGLGGARRSEAR